MPSLCACGKGTDLAAWLDDLPEGAIASSGHLNRSCPSCGSPIELVLGNGRITLGYTYAAGESHFEPIREVKLPGLRVVPSAPDDLDVHLEGRHSHFGVHRPSRLRFAVLPAAWARGRRLGELDFGTLAVSVEALEREGVREPPDLERVLDLNDSLILAGPQPALTRAWLYMNQGPG